MQPHLSRHPFTLLPIVYFAILASILTLYSLQAIFPRETYRDLLAQSFKYDLISKEVVKRSPTGWGADRATECLSLGMGLKKSTFSESLLNFYPNQVGTYNPCAGLLEWSVDNENQYSFEQYARYWHGHSEILRWFILLFGIPFTRASLATLLIGLYLFLGFTIYKLLNSKVPLILYAILVSLCGAFFLSGSIDLQNSMTHLFSELSLIVIAIISLRVLLNNGRSALVWGFGIGGIYVTTSYMINPQSIPAVIVGWALIPILISHGTNRIELIRVWKRFANLMIGVGLGYLSLWVTKWVLIEMFTSFPIWDDVIAQASHRSSQSVSDLSTGVSANLEFVANLPTSLQAITANVTALGIKFWDPRFGSILGPLILCAGVMLGFSIMNKQARKSRAIAGLSFTINLIHIAIANTLSLVMLLVWYSFMAQHSFDHATYTYRSLAILLSGLIFSMIASLPLKSVKNGRHET